MDLQKSLKTNLLLVIGSLILGLVATYIYLYIHHQGLNDMEKITNKQTRMIEQIKKGLEEEYQNVEKINDDLVTLKNTVANYPQTDKGELLSEGEGGIINDNPDNPFKPLKTDKFPSFKDLIGCDDVIDKLNDFLNFVNHREQFQNIGDIKTPLGILFYGTPGTGKTFITRALAKEAGLPFFNVSASEFSKSIKGQAPQAVKDLFASARKYADSSQGAIIFIDECEAPFADISQLATGRDNEIINVVNAFKEEITSYLNNPDKPIFIVGATNHPEKIEEAIRSRLTYQIEIEPSNQEGRQKYLEFRINKRKNPYSDEAVKYLLEVINKAIEDFKMSDPVKATNRTLENLLEAAVNNYAKRRNIKDENDKINKEDLKKAYQTIIDKDTTVLDRIEAQK